MYKKILITGGSTKISSHLKKLINRKFKIYSPSKKEWDLSNLDFSKDKINLIKKCDKIFLFHSILSNKKHLIKNNHEITLPQNTSLSAAVVRTVATRLLVRWYFDWAVEDLVCLRARIYAKTRT